MYFLRHKYDSGWQGRIVDMTQGERELVIALVCFFVGGLCTGLLGLILT
jgi:hypothetical protein